MHKRVWVCRCVRGRKTSEYMRCIPNSDGCKLLNSTFYARGRQSQVSGDRESEKTMRRALTPNRRDPEAFTSQTAKEICPNNVDAISLRTIFWIFKLPTRSTRPDILSPINKCILKYIKHIFGYILLKKLSTKYISIFKPVKNYDQAIVVNRVIRLFLYSFRRSNNWVKLQTNVSS